MHRVEVIQQWWLRLYVPKELHVVEFMSMLDHGLHKLLEDSIHVSALPRPDSLQKTNMASIRSKDQSDIRVLLSSFYWDSLRNQSSKMGVLVVKRWERERWGGRESINIFC